MTGCNFYLKMTDLNKVKFKVKSKVKFKMKLKVRTAVKKISFAVVLILPDNDNAD